MSKAERTKQMIIEKAAPIFNEKGIAGTSIDDVLKAANVAKGCLYGHFESKEALSYASLDYMLGRLKEKRETYIRSSDSAKGKLYAVMENYKNPLQTMFPGGCPVLNFSAEADDTNPVIREKIQRFMQDAIHSLEQIVSQGIHDGEFDENMSASGFASKMFSAIEGGIMMCRVMQSLSPIQEVTRSLKAEIEHYSLKS